jgi:tRNA pseudouridine38-40 synthase
VPRYRILVAYDGTDFSGWQRQVDRRSVQQTIEEALLPLSPGGAPVVVNGSGRTDAGVHARGQVAHFDLDRDIDGSSLRRALNDRLPEDVRVLRAEPAPPDFDARLSAHGKEYRYRVWNAEVSDPLLRRFRHRVSRALDLGAMRRAAACFVGEHDFAAFTANPQRPVESTVRRVFSVEVVADEDSPEVEIRVAGEGFLYKMVRSIAGFLLAVGTGKEKPEAAAEVLASRVRTARVESAPAQGLTLWRVWYGGAREMPPSDRDLFPPFRSGEKIK